MNKTTKKIMSILLSVALIIPLFSATIFVQRDVQAASKKHWVILDRTDITCDYKDFSEDYGTHTRKLKVKDTSSAMDDDAEGRYVYCIQPSKNSPNENKKYYISKFVDDDTDGKYAKIRTVLWFSPGFAGKNTGKALLAEVGLNNDAEHCYGYAHAAMAYLYGASDWNSGLYESTQNKIKNWITAVLQHEEEIPMSFRIYVCKTESDRQDFVGGFYEQTGYVKIKKVSALSEVTNGNSCYNLAGATFSVFEESNCAESQKVGALTATSSGETQTLEVTEGTYYVKETGAPTGYVFDPNAVYEVEVDGSNDENNPAIVQISDPPQMGNFELDKLDKETNLNIPQGASTLTGHRYQVEFFPNANGDGSPQRTWVFATDSEGKIKYNSNYLVNDSTHTSSPLFKNDKGAFAVPLGYIKVKEIAMNKDDEGYVFYLKDEALYGGQIKANTGTNPSATANTVHVTSKDQVPRADIEVHKQDEANKPLSVPFRITSQTTGESHEFMTNKSGDYSSSSDWRPHSQDTNGGTVQSGLWFNGYNDEETGAPVNDELGALPYDTYIVEELPCEANAKYDLDTEIIVVQEKGVAGKVTLNITNKAPIPGIKTSAKDKATNSHKAFVSKTTTIVDTVSYEELNTSKEYTIKGVLMSKETGEPLLINGEEVRAESEPFIPETSDGEIQLEFTFDSSDLAGQSTVVFEELYLNGEIKADHKKIDDEGQTVEFVEPEIGTQAKDTATGTNNSSPSSEATFVDTVMYKNLSTEDTYKAVGVLYDKEAEETLKDEEGNEITAESEPFKPEKNDGETEVTFKVDTTKLAGKELVCFEKLYIVGKNDEGEEPNETEIASHEDPEDGGQTLVIANPKMNTTAKDKEGNKITSGKTITIVDKIDYKGFTPGKEYIVRGTLMDKKTGKSTGITASKKFTPEEANGTVDVSFKVDGKKWAGHKLVCFEEASPSEKPKDIIAYHKDIKDKAQTVTIKKTSTPNVKTGDRIGFLIIIILSFLVVSGYCLQLTRKKETFNIF